MGDSSSRSPQSLSIPKQDTPSQTDPAAAESVIASATSSTVENPAERPVDGSMPSDGLQKKVEEMLRESRRRRETLQREAAERKERADNLQYIEGIVTFIDILGFRELVLSKSAKELAGLVNIFRERTADPEVPGVTVIAFSDSIIRIRPQSSISGLFFELIDLLHAQAELIGRGVLVRGGIAYGNVAVYEGSPYGSAFIEAYELESKIAVYPRLVVSPSLLERFAKGELPFVKNHNLSEEASYIKNILKMGDDGLWFIDYLRAFESEVDKPDKYHEFVRDHADHIKGLADKVAKQKGAWTSLTAKANWLARYHNAYVIKRKDKFIKAGVDINTLLISTSELPTLFSFTDLLSR